MRRTQSSHGSEGEQSHGSGSSSGSSFRPNAGSGLDGEDAASAEGVLEAGVFGTLFTEKHYSTLFVAFRLFMDWIQTFLILVSPAYGWDINPGNKVWQVFSFIQLNYFMSSRGYTFFLICMYIMAIALAANVALCVWVSHSFGNNKFDHVWPIVVLRYFSLVFYQVLDIASLSLFLMTMDCAYFPGPTQGYNQEFPSVSVSIAVFFVLASLFTMGEIELDPVSTNIMGMGHTGVETWGFCIRMFMTCASVFVNNNHWLSVLQLASILTLCWLYLRWLPHQTAIINYIRVGGYFTVLWAALLYIIMAFEPGVDPDDDVAAQRQRHGLTTALWAGFIPVGLLGAGLTYLHTRYYMVTVANKFRTATPGTHAKRIHKFKDAREVEIALRVCRVWVEEDVLDEAAVDLGERIIKAGMQLMPYEPFVAIWWSSFLIDVQGSYQSGYSELQTAKKSARLSFLQRFAVFIREQEHTQKASAASSGDNSGVDLVSYVEFQRNYRLTIRLHMDALAARRDFWELLLHTRVTFDQIAAAVQRFETSVRATERMCKQVLARHSSSVKILVLYVKFLQTMRNDPWTAAKWSAEAEKLQHAEEEANERAVLGQGTGARKIEGFDENKAIIIIGANCLMRMVNESAANMLGYTVKSELVGRNINIIVPPPFDKAHNSYVRNYVDTGIPKIMDKIGDAVMVHRDRYVVPIRLFVTKVSGIGEDSVFMGVFQQLPVEQDTATVWVMTTGQVLSCDSSFTDWLGYKQGDLHGKAFKDLVVQQDLLEEMLSGLKAEAHAALTGIPRNRRCSLMMTDSGPSMTMPPSPPAAHEGPQQGATGRNRYHVSTAEHRLSGLQFRHCYLPEEFDFEVRVKSTGLSDMIIHVFKLKRKDDLSHHLMVVDPKGRISHVTEAFAARLGTTASKLQAGNVIHAVDVLLPPPFVKLHAQHLRHTRLAESQPPPWSCQSGLTMMLNATSKMGTEMVPFSMDFRRIDVAGRDPLTVVHLEERTLAYALDERRLQLVINGQGVVREVSGSPTKLFSLDPQALVGSHMVYILDALRPEADPLNPNPAAVFDQEEAAARLLVAMAKKSYQCPGMSWRVGVSPIMDPLALMALGPMARTMLAADTVPAVMTIMPHMARPAVDGAKAVLPTEMLYKVELWRSDMLSGVLELDNTGAVQQVGLRDQPLFSPHLLLGLPANMLQGAHMSSLLPLSGKPMLDALFTEGSFQHAHRGSKTGGMAASGRSRGGGLRGANNMARKRGVGPVHTIKLTHGTDGQDVGLQVQAVVKQDVGSGCQLYILLHLAEPSVGRADFKDWVSSCTAPADIKVLLGCHRSLNMQLSQGKGSNKSQIMEPVPPPAPRPSEKPTTSFLIDMPSIDMRAVHSDSPGGHDSGALVKKHKRAIQLAGQVDGISSLPAALAQAPQLEAAPSSMKEMESLQLLTKAFPFDAPASAASSPRVKAAAAPERIATWVAKDASVAGQLSPAASLSEVSSDEEEVPAGQEQVNVDDHADDHENEADGVDEAGNVMNDLQRGKRLRKLVRLLSGPQAQHQNLRFKHVSLAMVGIIILVDLIMFITFLLLTKSQVETVTDLRSSARACTTALQVVMDTSIIGQVLANITDPSIRHMGMEGRSADLLYSMDLMRNRLSDLNYMHDGMYRGFHKARQLPTAFGIRALWDEPALPVRQYYQDDVNGTYSLVTNRSLWRLGNEYILAAGNLLQNLQRNYGLDTNNSMAVLNNTDYLYVLYNGPRQLMTAYAQTLDGLMQSAIQDSKQVNSVQLVVLAVEGAVFGFAAFLLVLYTARKVVKQRHSVFEVFMCLPHGIVKAQASQVVQLVEGEVEGDGEGDEEDGGEELMSFAAQDVERNQGGSLQTSSKQVAAVKMRISASGKGLTESDTAKSGWRGLLTALAPWRQGTVHPERVSAAGKRLQTSSVAALRIAWPFLFWACFVIIINGVGYLQLSSISSPVAVSNLVQFVSIRVNKVLLTGLRLVSDTQLDPKAGYTTTKFAVDHQVTQEQLDLIELYRTTLRQDLSNLLLEYDAMLYGREATAVHALPDPSPHFLLAKEGVIASQGANYLFHYQGCLAEDTNDCLAPDAPFYKFVSQGLDGMLTHFFDEVEALLKLPPDMLNLTAPPFNYIFTIGNSDLNGGLDKLIDIYSAYVVAAYNSAITLHIISLVIAVLIGVLVVFFIQRPASNNAAHEAKRVAELLSQLPSELDVEGLVTDALRSCNALPAGSGDDSPSGRLTQQQSSLDG